MHQSEHTGGGERLDENLVIDAGQAGGARPQPRGAVRAGWLLGSLIMALSAAGGCSGSPSTGEVQAIRFEFRTQLVQATQAINEGEFERARGHLERARSRAINEELERKVTSLEHLIDGAEALRSGDADLARSEWLQIRDPALRREVAEKARQIGIDLESSNAAFAREEGRR